jgi:hypothetical protein
MIKIREYKMVKDAQTSLQKNLPDVAKMKASNLSRTASSGKQHMEWIGYACS